eukprot:Polyplicarium_translucidae@DN3400_c0_g1_i3.p1
MRDPLLLCLSVATLLALFAFMLTVFSRQVPELFDTPPAPVRSVKAEQRLMDTCEAPPFDTTEARWPCPKIYKYPLPEEWDFLVSRAASSRRRNPWLLCWSTLWQAMGPCARHRIRKKRISFGSRGGVTGSVGLVRATGTQNRAQKRTNFLISFRTSRLHTLASTILLSSTSRIPPGLIWKAGFVKVNTKGTPADLDERIMTTDRSGSQQVLHRVGCAPLRLEETEFRRGVRECSCSMTSRKHRTLRICARGRGSSTRGLWGDFMDVHRSMVVLNPGRCSCSSRPGRAGSCVIHFRLERDQLVEYS